MAAPRLFTPADTPQRLAVPFVASASVIVVRNVGATPVWVGDEAVAPGRGMPLYAGEDLVATDPEVWVAAVTDLSVGGDGLITGDWGAQVAWEVRAP